MPISTINTNSIADDAVTVPKVTDQVLTHRNLIINGAMNIAQRGTSSTATIGYNVIDRFMLSNINTNTTITQSRQYDGPDGFQYCFEIKNTTDGTPGSAAYSECQHRVEAINARAVNQADSFTVSFYYKSNVTGTLPVQIYHRTDANSVWRNWQGLSVTGDETWRRAEFTFTKNSAVAALPKVDSDWGFIVAFNFELGTDYAGPSNENTWINDGSVAGPNFGLCGNLNDYIRITGLQVELGDTATPFEHRSYGDELARCQRYYQKDHYEGSGLVTVGHAISGTSAVAAISYSGGQMRTAPTITLPTAGQGASLISFLNAGSGYPTTTGSHTTPSISNISFRFSGNSYAGLAAGNASWLWTGSGAGGVYFEYDAEL